MHLHVPRPSQGGARRANPEPDPRPTLVAVHAHPDDECLPTGGVLARYGAEGVRTVLITCTGGEVGEIADPALATPENLGEVRARELAESVRILGIDRAVQLGYRDSGMAGTADNDNPAAFLHADFDEAVRRVVAILREEHADVVVTYDEKGGYGHPDHIRAHQVAVAAFHAAGDPTRYPETGSAWAPRKLYYAILTRSAMRRFGETLRAAGVEVPFRDDENPGMGVDDDRLTTVVDVAAYAETKRQALLAHRTQLGSMGFFVNLPPELYGQLATHETFQRVEPPPDGGFGLKLEDDLLTGL
jgi:N-acetyl-1-D-myo-inositol-2-amino-2-deoxy-alpha-D-glucopyranoside deacetylase